MNKPIVLAAALTLLALVGCSSSEPSSAPSQTPSATPSTATTSSTPTVASSSPAAPSSAASSAAASTPAASEPANSPSPGAVTKHNPKYPQVKQGVLLFDLLPGWTREKTAPDFSGVALRHQQSKVVTMMITMDNILHVKGRSLQDATAGICGVLAEEAGKAYFKPGYTEASHHLRSTKVGKAYTCGVKGTVRGGTFKNQQAEYPIIVFGRDDGQAMIQMTMFPVKGDAKALTQAGNDAADMLKQATYNFYGKEAW